jgi:hypothetical protein
MGGKWVQHLPPLGKTQQMRLLSVYLSAFPFLFYTLNRTLAIKAPNISIKKGV